MGCSCVSGLGESVAGLGRVRGFLALAGGVVVSWEGGLGVWVLVSVLQCLMLPLGVRRVALQSHILPGMQVVAWLILW